jgi:hypothetical protein
MTTANSDVTASGRRRGPGRPFPRGLSGNPSGRPKLDFDLRDLAREHGPACIKLLAAMAGLLPDEPPAVAEAVRLAALKELLDRGFGRATLPLTGDSSAPPVALSFEWANAMPALEHVNGDETDIVVPTSG